MKFKTKTAKKTRTAPLTPDWSIEEQVYRLRRRMQMMKIPFTAHINMGKGDAQEILAGTR